MALHCVTTVDNPESTRMIGGKEAMRHSAEDMRNLEETVRGRLQLAQSQKEDPHVAAKDVLPELCDYAEALRDHRNLMPSVASQGDTLLEIARLVKGLSDMLDELRSQPQPEG